MNEFYLLVVVFFLFVAAILLLFEIAYLKQLSDDLNEICVRYKNCLEGNSSLKEMATINKAFIEKHSCHENLVRGECTVCQNNYDYFLDEL